MKTLIPLFALLYVNALFAQTNENLDTDKNDTPTTYKIERLPFNGNGAEFSPLIYKSGLLFCRNTRDDYWNNNAQLAGNIEIYYTELGNNGGYENPVKLKGDINTHLHEGQATVSPNGKHLYFTQERRQEGKKTVWGIFDAEMLYGRWSDVKVLYHGFKQNNLAHPTLSADGNKLYFAAQLPNGLGGMDIYVCEKKGNFWGIPTNLGASVNSKGDELFPFIHPDGTLYFTSNGKDGLGGLDIFSSTQQNGKWTDAQNLPAPINSPKDDFSLTFSKDKKIGYLSTTRNGNADIFKLQADETIAPSFFTALDHKPHNDNNNNKETQVASPVKAVSVANPANAVSMYDLIDEKLFDAKNPILNAALHIEPRFEIGSANLLPETKTALDKVAALLHANQTLMIDIAAHTDTRGEANTNLVLSTKRANAARNYLLLQNIASERMSAHGYGEMHPINYCKEGINCPEEKHAENNRLEFYLSAGQLLTMPVANYSVQTAPVRGTAVLPVYEVQVGPLKNIDTRTYYEYKQISPNLNFEDTPKGKVVIFGPYDTELQAQKERVKVSQHTTQKADAVVKTTMKTVTLPNAKDQQNKFEVYVGPYKHVTTDIYHQFTQLNMHTGIRYTAKGTMVVLGPFNSLQEAENAHAKLPQTLLSRKTSSTIYTDGGKTLLKSFKKGKRIKR
jgi:outer membrane protein OmpA-like peptidoglycan-associated protein